MKIFIPLEGDVKFIYSDDLAGLLQIGEASIERASNVEPCKEGGWTAEMKDGTVLGPYPLRQIALDAEVKYLEERLKDGCFK